MTAASTSALRFTSVYPKAVVCAVGPEQLNFELLKLNCADSKVKLVHGAVAAEAGTLQLHDPGEGEWGFRTIAGNDNTKLYVAPAFSVADLLAMQPGQPFILKIDIEGAKETCLVQAAT